MLAVIMCLASIPAVFAATTPPEGTPDAPAQAGITKILKVPVGTDLPAGMSFNFEVEKVSYNGDTSATGAMPDLGTAGNVNIPVSGDGTTVNGITTYVLESGNLAGINWPNTGIYKYKITEIDESANYNQDPDVKEETHFSGAEYTLTVYVREGKTQAGDTVLYVHYAEGVVVIVDDDDVAHTGDKVDPTPGGNKEDYFYSQIIFTNRYVKTNLIVDPTTEEGPLAVSKAVEGVYANHNQFFQFKLTMAAPSISDFSGPFKAYILEGTTVVDLDDVDNPNTKTDTDAKGDYIEFTNDPNGTTFYLKDGQRLAFLDTPVGTSFTAIETEVTGYVTNILLHGENRTSRSTGLQYVADKAGSLAAYTNTNNGTPPTGLNLNDLPFIAMIILAAGAFIALAVAKSRKRKASDNI